MKQRFLIGQIIGDLMERHGLASLPMPAAWSRMAQRVDERECWLAEFGDPTNTNPWHVRDRLSTYSELLTG